MGYLNTHLCSRCSRYSFAWLQCAETVCSVAHTSRASWPWYVGPFTVMRPLSLRGWWSSFLLHQARYHPSKLFLLRYDLSLLCCRLLCSLFQRPCCLSCTGMSSVHVGLKSFLAPNPVPLVVFCDLVSCGSVTWPCRMYCFVYSDRSVSQQCTQDFLCISWLGVSRVEAL